MQEYDVRKYKMNEMPHDTEDIKTNDKEYSLQELTGMVYDKATEILNSKWKTMERTMNAAQIQSWVCGNWNMVSKYDNLDTFNNWDEWLNDVIIARLGVEYD